MDDFLFGPMTPGQKVCAALGGLILIALVLGWAWATRSRDL